MVFVWVEVVIIGGVDDCFFDYVIVVVGVEFRVVGYSFGFFVCDLVVVVVDYGVDVEGEEVLVVIVEDVGVDDGVKGVWYFGEVEVERLGG